MFMFGPVGPMELALIVLVIAPLFVLWIVALFHIVARRPDLSVSWKGIWSVVVLLLGYAGLLLYVMFRPPTPVFRTGTGDNTAGRAALKELGQLIEEDAFRREFFEDNLLALRFNAS